MQPNQTQRQCWLVNWIFLLFFLYCKANSTLKHKCFIILWCKFPFVSSLEITHVNGFQVGDVKAVYENINQRKSSVSAFVKFFPKEEANLKSIQGNATELLLKQINDSPYFASVHAQSVFLPLTAIKGTSDRKLPHLPPTIPYAPHMEIVLPEIFGETGCNPFHLSKHSQTSRDKAVILFLDSLSNEGVFKLPRRCSLEQRARNAIIAGADAVILWEGVNSGVVGIRTWERDGSIPLMKQKEKEIWQNVRYQCAQERAMHFQNTSFSKVMMAATSVTLWNCASAQEHWLLTKGRKADRVDWAFAFPIILADSGFTRVVQAIHQGSTINAVLWIHDNPWENVVHSPFAVYLMRVFIPFWGLVNMIMSAAFFLSYFRFKSKRKANFLQISVLVYFLEFFSNMIRMLFYANGGFYALNIPYGPRIVLVTLSLPFSLSSTLMVAIGWKALVDPLLKKNERSGNSLVGIKSKVVASAKSSWKSIKSRNRRVNMSTEQIGNSTPDPVLGCSQTAAGQNKSDEVNTKLCDMLRDLNGNPKSPPIIKSNSISNQFTESTIKGSKALKENMKFIVLILLVFFVVELFTSLLRSFYIISHLVIAINGIMYCTLFFLLSVFFFVHGLRLLYAVKRLHLDVAPQLRREKNPQIVAQAKVAASKAWRHNPTNSGILRSTNIRNASIKIARVFSKTKFPKTIPETPNDVFQEVRNTGDSDVKNEGLIENNGLNPVQQTTNHTEIDTNDSQGK